MKYILISNINTNDGQSTCAPLILNTNNGETDDKVCKLRRDMCRFTISFCSKSLFFKYSPVHGGICNSITNNYLYVSLCGCCLRRCWREGGPFKRRKGGKRAESGQLDRSERRKGRERGRIAVARGSRSGLGRTTRKMLGLGLRHLNGAVFGTFIPSGVGYSKMPHRTLLSVLCDSVLYDRIRQHIKRR